ncbi:MAG: Ku protein [Bdellovibrionales bacterium]|nr:Ku protein [Ramlibacter sp.]
MPSASTRVTWKGAISFGLVHIPIELRSATLESRPQFKWIDSQSKSAVGNQQVSKATGQAIDPEKLVKGVEYDDGQFVTLTKEEIRAALPKTTQTIEIEAFVDAGSIPLAFFLKPYHVSPLGKGQKAYALLRETLKKTGKVGIAKVVISTRQHLAALLPQDNGMLLNLLRWEEEVRDMTGLALPDASVAVSDKEMKMAEMLVNDLAAEWSPGLFHDEFKEQLQTLIETKAKAGKLISVANASGSEGEPVRSSGEVLNLTELLQQSLRGKGTAPRPSGKSSNDSNVTPLRAAAAKKAPAKARAFAKAPATKAAGKRASA